MVIRWAARAGVAIMPERVRRPVGPLSEAWIPSGPYLKVAREPVELRVHRWGLNRRRRNGGVYGESLLGAHPGIEWVQLHRGWRGEGDLSRA